MTRMAQPCCDLSSAEAGSERARSSSMLAPRFAATWCHVVAPIRGTAPELACSGSHATVNHAGGGRFALDYRDLDR